MKLNEIINIDIVDVDIVCMFDDSVLLLSILLPDFIFTHLTNTENN